MNTPLILAAGGLALVGLAHSVLGELLVFRTLRTHDVVPTAGYPVLRERQLRIVWASWHLVTVLGWALSAMLWRLGTGPSDAALGPWLTTVAAVASLACSLLVFCATRGRHPAWFVLLLVAALAGWR